MVAENIQIFCVQVSGKRFANQKNESRQRRNSLPGLYHHPKAKTNYSFPQLRGRTMKTYFKMNCLKPTFLKHVTEECTFC